MVIAYDAEAVAQYMKQAVEYSQERPVLVDHFLEDAVEVDVDALCDCEGCRSSPESCSTSKKPAFTPATRRACCLR